MLATPGCTPLCCNWHNRSHSCHLLTHVVGTSAELSETCKSIFGVCVVNTAWLKPKVCLWQHVFGVQAVIEGSSMQEYTGLLFFCHSMAHTKGKPAVCVSVQAVLVCKQCWCASCAGVQAVLVCKQCWCVSSGPRIIDVDHRCIPNMASQILLHQNMCQPGRSLTGLGWTCAYRAPL